MCREILEETKGDEEVETPIRDCQERKKEEGRQRKIKWTKNHDKKKEALWVNVMYINKRKKVLFIYM